MKKREWEGKYAAVACMIAKYIFPVILACLSYSTVGHGGYIVFAVSDVLIIMSGTNILLKKSHHFYWLNCALMFLVNVELGVLYFSGSVVTLTMIQSLNSAKALAGHAFSYLGGAAVVVVFSFLPVTEIKLKKKGMNALAAAAAVALQLVLVAAMGTNYSMWQSVYGVYSQQKAMWELTKVSGSVLERPEELGTAESPESVESSGTTESSESVKSSESNASLEPDESEEIIGDGEFYKKEIADYYCKPEVLPEQPNIILIFTEGLSQNIVEDEREIMPNVAKLQTQSIDFKNYYNHTFATYRGLQGQLFSAYQMNDSDSNSLISIQEILRKKGYYTAFINTESKNRTFSKYLAGLGFDDVLADTEKNGGPGDTQSDKEAYEVLLKNAMELEAGEKPFFLAIYTVGTHVSFDSVDEVFGDGKSNVLNRFYNVDYQFGNFFQKFKESELAEDTVLIFTADHATFEETDFQKAFPDYERICTAMDEIPLSIYYEGVKPESVDAEGRNSLDLAPSILDFLDVSEGNYFLGESLFMPKAEGPSCDTVFFNPDAWLTTDGGSISELSEEQAEYILPKAARYFALAGAK